MCDDCQMMIDCQIAQFFCRRLIINLLNALYPVTQKDMPDIYIYIDGEIL